MTNFKNISWQPNRPNMGNIWLVSLHIANIGLILSVVVTDQFSFSLLLCTFCCEEKAKNVIIIICFLFDHCLFVFSVFASLYLFLHTQLLCKSLLYLEK